MGHRLYLLKQIYNLKIAHGVKFEKDDYIPICTSPPLPPPSHDLLFIVGYLMLILYVVAAPKGDEEDESVPANVLKNLRDRGIVPRELLILKFFVQILKYQFLSSS